MARGTGEGSGLWAVLPTLAAKRRAASSVLKICNSLHGPARASGGEGTQNPLVSPCNARLSSGSKRRRQGSSALGAHWRGWEEQWPSAGASGTLLAAALGAILVVPICAQLPVSPSKLDFSQFQYTSVNASWTGVSTGPGAAASYDLRWRAAGAAVWMAGREFSAVESSFVVAGLQASTQYEFILQSRNNKGDYSAPITAFAETLSDFRATNVRPVVIKDKEVSITWEPVKGAAVLVQQVFVSKDSGNTWRYNAIADQGPMLPPSVASHTVPFLSPMAKYLFRVETVFLGLLGVSPSVSSQTVTTLPASPQMVEGLRIQNLHPTSATLSWEPLVGTGKMGGLSVIYLVDVAEMNAPPSSRETYVVRDASSLQVSKLLRNVQHFFTVVAENDQGLRSMPSEPGVFTTPGALAAQMDPPLVSKTSTGLLIQWNPLVTNVARGGLSIDSFVIYTKRQDEVGFDSGLNVGNVLSYHAVGLAPNFFYEFSISGVNSVGTGPRGKASDKAMPPIPPSMQAPSVQVYDNGHTSVIEVSWAAPALDVNILEYRVFLHQIVPFTARDNGTVVPATERKHRFHNLPDGTRFEIKLAAQTAVGLTNISAGVLAETYSDTIPTSVRSSLEITGLTSCRLNISWTKQRLPATDFRIFATIKGIFGAYDYLLGSGTQSYFLTDECIRGATFVHYVQAVFSKGSGGGMSLASPALDAPVSPPLRMPGPTLSLNPSNPSTSIIVQWVPPVVVNPVPKTAISHYILTVGNPSENDEKVLTIAAPSSSYTLTGLSKKTFYTFRIQAVNSLGPSDESPLSSKTTEITPPSPVTNLTVVPGSEGEQGDFLTLRWEMTDWGESAKVQSPFPYPYCPINQPAGTHCEGRRYFLATPFRVGDDYAEPIFIYGNAFQYTITGLSGGVDYTFMVEAVNTGGLKSMSTRLKYRTVSVVPRAITSLNVFSPAVKDLQNAFRIGLEWKIPIDAETTGGMALSGFVLRYAQLTSCLSCMDSGGACIAQRANPPWVVEASVGTIDQYIFIGLKGSTYIFSMAAVNGKGQGVFWPTCQVGDINCHGTPNGQIPYTCHSAAYTAPSQPANFGKWAELQPGVQPSSTTSFDIRWGGGNPEYFEYSDKSLNGGRNIEMVEVQRTKKSKVRWPLDYYCPTLPAVLDGEQPVCLYETGCAPSPCIAACPICLTQQLDENAFVQKKITDYLTGDSFTEADTYIYRIRFSNVASNDCASRPPSPGSSPICTWSEWSDLAEVQIPKQLKFHNLFTKVNSPTAVQILWFVPAGVVGDGATTAAFGDFVNIWFGPTVASVSIAPFTNGNVTRGPARGLTYQTFEIAPLVPATTYYFSVVAYYSTDNVEIQQTRSAVTLPITTAVGKPARVVNTSVAVPTSAQIVQKGGLKISWIQLSTVCEKGTGLFLADGSADNCQRGEGIPLAYYTIYYRRVEGSDVWQSVQVASSLNSYTITGLGKEVPYFFKVSATNSKLEGDASVQVRGTPIATIPGSPPPPLSTGASVSSVRVAWKEPSDLGTQQIMDTKFRLTIYPRRDGQFGNETITFTWEREFVVTGLLPNSLYLFSVSYQATPMLGFGFPSKTSYVYTTPLPPVNLRLIDGKNVTESTTVRVKWDWTGVIQGNGTVSGYRLSFSSTDGTSDGQTFCSGGAIPVDGIPGAVTECVLAGLVNGKLYAIRISASNDPRLETSFGPESEPMMLQTKAALPTVVSIQFTETSGYSTKIHWTTFDGGLSIIGYSLMTSRESEEYTTGQPMTGVVSVPSATGIRSSYVVTGLGANLFYRFKVVATNALGFRPSEPSDEIRTKPAGVSVPTVVSVSTNSAEVSWPVWYGKSPVVDYSIQARMNIDAANIGPWFVSGTAQGQRFQLSSLLANTGYDIRVAAINSAGTGDYGDSVRIKTQAAPPDFLYVMRIGAGDCDLRWDPKPGATPQYTVFPIRWALASASWIEETSRSKSEGEIDFFHVTGLVKGARYKFQVATSSSLGVGERSAISHEITTLSSLPEPGPKPILSNPSTQGLRVTWPAVISLDSNGGSPVTAYVLYSYAHKYQGGGWKVEARLDAPQDQFGNILGPIPNTYFANALDTDVYYQFKVAVENANGLGPQGPASEEMPTVPGAMKAPFQEAFLKTILLTWTPPENNSFTAYRVGFSEQNDNPGLIASDESQLWTPWIFQILPASTTLLKFDSLKQDYPYRFKVAARNPSGWGSDSPIVASRTTIVSDPWSMYANGELALQVSATSITTTSARLTWLGPASTDQNKRGSSIGFRVIACQAENLICDTGDEYFVYCQVDPPNEYTRSHECDRTKNNYLRQGLLKNTLYYFQLSIVNSGGEGPRSKNSPQFRTYADYPVQMARPVAVSNSLDSISVSWNQMVDWNQRGGLDLTGYVLFKQAQGFSYDAGEVVYEGTSYTYTELPSNTKYYFSVIAENTWCTLCRTDIIVPDGSCYFEPCCKTHSCSSKSMNSIPVSTKPGKMTLPRLQSATIYDIIVTWDVVPGTPNNIFAYELRFRDIDRADKDDSGGWVERVFAGTELGIGVKNYPLVNLDPNNRYEVILNADNGFGYGDPSDSAILMTKANQIQAVEVVAVRATEVTLEWLSPPGRRNNILGYNISYRLATATEIALQQQSETLPLSHVFSSGFVTRFDVTNLLANASYIFSVAAVNGGGIGEYSAFTRPYRTMILDLLGSCYFYPIADDGKSVQGSFILQQKAAGTATLSGIFRGLQASDTYALESWQYGKSSTNKYGVQRLVTVFAASLEGEHKLMALETSLGLLGPLSAISSSFRLRRVLDNVTLSQCEMGIARPRSGAEENGAVPAAHVRAYCTLIPMSAVKLSGGFIASPSDIGIRVRGRVCGISEVSPTFSVRLHEFGDLQPGNYNDVGNSVDDMGIMYVDNLQSANFDLINALDIGFSTGPGLINLLGRSVVLYNQTFSASDNPDPSRTALAACVWGAYEPSIDTSVYQVKALPPVCTECTWLMGLQESMFTVAEMFNTDWISVWSLNKANNPDKDNAGTSVYYAHPYVMLSGETMASVRHRFGITSEHIALLNNMKTDFVPGEVMCIVPQWTNAIDRNGEYVCSANSSAH